jgi:transcriptional regulator with XRE-family HTH domain
MQIGLNEHVLDFSVRVKTRRIALGLTQGDVAKISGLKQSDISKIETGRIQETTKMIGLARALQCDAEWLSTGRGEASALQSPRQTTSQSISIEQMKLSQALDLIESALIRLDLVGRERVAPLFESLARSPGAVIKKDIEGLLRDPEAKKSSTEENSVVQKRR